MEDLYLYHATDRKNLEAILKNGLLTHPPHHMYEGYDCEGKIYLAFDPDIAESYVEASDESPDDIVVLKIGLSMLKPENIGYDWNNRCEYESDINSCVYYADIPGNCIQECNPSNEPSQTIKHFKGTDLYEIVLGIFDEEVETNLENYDY